MADVKTPKIETVEPVSEAGAAIKTTSSLAARFEHYQHSLTRWDALKQNKKPIAWCKVSLVGL